jgi:hypothetical protein
MQAATATKVKTRSFDSCGNKAGTGVLVCCQLNAGRGYVFCLFINSSDVLPLPALYVLFVHQRF